jgi:hypothetical protein
VKTYQNGITWTCNDVINLNVGGKRMTTTRSTLCQVERSLLADIFNHPSQEFAGLPCDTDGFIFLDFNPKHFALILDCLRAKKISTSKNPALLPKMSSNETKSFKHLVQHLGLTEEIFPVIKESFMSHCSEIDMDGSNGYAIFPRHNNASRSVTAFAFGTYIY